MRVCTLCGQDREEVSVFPVAPATWNGFCNFAQVCSECATQPKNRVRLKAPAVSAAAKAIAEAVPETTTDDQISISHRRTGVVLMSVEGRTLARANLAGAALSGADLQHIELSEADLHGADLRLADLSGALLRGADLRGADLRGADLRGADLRSAKLHRTNLQSARYDQRTAWPSDFDPRGTGAIVE
jgi:hypothetical protein